MAVDTRAALEDSTWCGGARVQCGKTFHFFNSIFEVTLNLKKKKEIRLTFGMVNSGLARDALARKVARSDVSRTDEDRSIRDRSRALRADAPEALSDCPRTEEDEVSLAREESRADVPEVFIATCGFHSVGIGETFFRDNIIILEARSILYGVRYAESNYPPGRHLIFLTILRWYWRSAQGVHQISHRFHAWDLCAWFPSGFCLIFQVDTVRVEVF